MASEHRPDVLQMSKPWIDSPEEDHAIVTAKHTSPSCTNVPAVVVGEERSPKAIEGRVVERAVQFASLCRHQGAPEPDVRVLIILDLPDRIDQADITITRKSCTCANRTVKTFGVEGELDVLMDLSVDIDTSIVDIEVVGVSITVRCRPFLSIETGAYPHSDANPLVIVGLDRATSVRTGNRGYYPRHQRHGGPSNQQYFPPSLLIYLHGISLPSE